MAKRVTNKALSHGKQANAWLGGCFAVAFCGMFTLIGGSFLFVATIMPLVQGKWGWEMLFGLIGLPFLLIGLTGLVFILRAIGKPKDQTQRQSWRPSTVTPTIVGGDADEAAGDLPVELKTEKSPKATFVMAALFAGFWNTITWTITFVFVFSDWGADGFEWLPVAFMSIFVLVGLGLIAAAVYCFLAMYIPQPVLTLSRRRIPLGETAELTWRIEGDARKIQSMTVTLKGLEWAQYRRGTDTVTDEEVFYEQPIFDTATREEIASGKATLQIPIDTMHSFSATHNKIKWSIHVAGDIPRSPDINHDYPIDIAPIHRFAN